MAELTTLARPYAKAAFESAVTAKALAPWQQALSLLAAVSTEAEVVLLLKAPSLTFEAKSKALIEICGDVLSQDQQNFVQILAENKRLALLPHISELFDHLKAQQEKSVDVEIMTAFAIDKALEDKLSSTLTKSLDREVSLKTSIDKSLLGGALIRAGDTVIDGSVRGRIAKLSEAMNA